MFIKLNPKKISNESQWPTTHTVKFLQAGLVDYSDIGLGILNLPKDTIDDHLVNSFQDKPVVIKHQEVSPGNFQDLAVGYIKKVYYNSNDGWYYCDMLITRDEGHEMVRNGCGVSCAYKVGQLGAGGSKNNISYKGTIVSGEGEHLALVDHPRYEECRVVINGKDGVLYNEKEFLAKNQKQEESKMFFKFWGKKEDKGFSGDTEVTLPNGKKAKLSDIIKVNNEIESHEIDGSQEIELANGKKIKLEDAVNAFMAKNKATDEKEETDEEKAAKEAEAKKAENAKKLENCGCGGKDGKHMGNCTMYNEDGSDKEKKKEEKDEKMENAIKEIEKLKVENEALKAAQKNMGNFVKLNQAADKVVIENGDNGTSSSGTLESKMENSKKFFGHKQAAK